MLFFPTKSAVVSGMLLRLHLMNGCLVAFWRWRVVLRCFNLDVMRELTIG